MDILDYCSFSAEGRTLAVDILRQVGGWIIRVRQSDSIKKLYIRHIYRGRINWTTDYLYARETGLETAKKHAERVRSMLALLAMECRR